MTQFHACGLTIALASGLVATTLALGNLANASEVRSISRCSVSQTDTRPTTLSLLLVGGVSLVAASTLRRNRPG